MIQWEFWYRTANYLAKMIYQRLYCVSFKIILHTVVNATPMLHPLSFHQPCMSL